MDVFRGTFHLIKKRTVNVTCFWAAPLSNNRPKKKKNPKTNQKKPNYSCSNLSPDLLKKGSLDRYFTSTTYKICSSWNTFSFRVIVIFPHHLWTFWGCCCCLSTIVHTFHSLKSHQTHQLSTSSYSHPLIDVSYVPEKPRLATRLDSSLVNMEKILE